MNKTGFGFLRLPCTNPDDGSAVDYAAVCALVDPFMELGGNYFDTAYTYHGGNSEIAVREAVVKRYPRKGIRIADKLPTWLVKTRQDCDRIFDEQLKRCGVDAFDVYLLHGLDSENYAACETYDGFGFLRELKAAGKAGSIGFSFHDSPELLDRILIDHPETDYVQLQINYADWDSVAIQSRRCYETAAKHGKRIIVMEPVKGGSLAKLPPAAQQKLQALNPDASMASWAMRFVQNLPQVDVVLSGMNALSQIEDNLRPMIPLNAEEQDALMQAARIIRKTTAVACTGCGYCLQGCPARINIPGFFALYNEYMRSPSEKWKMEYLYADLSKKSGIANCVRCGDCEKSCPQKLSIRKNLREIQRAFDAN